LSKHAQSAHNDYVLASQLSYTVYVLLFPFATIQVQNALAYCNTQTIPGAFLTEFSESTSWKKRLRDNSFEDMLSNL
jgi:hypothetical protein